VAVGRLRLVNTPSANVQKGADGLLRTRDGTVPPADATVALNTKGLESSNVNSIDQMVEMLNSSRAFEINVKLLATAKELDDQTARLMRSDR
jgi:flagellar basal-body rod protein FlgF